MNTLYRNGNLKISVYADHNPPHFHVRTPEGDSMIDLFSFVEIETGANKKQLAKAISWAITHQDELHAEWQRLNPE
jgi:hypothetical protein